MIHVRHDLCMYAQGQSALPSTAKHDSFTHVPWLLCTCAITHLCMRNDSHAPWPLYAWAVSLPPFLVLRRMTRSYICYGSFIYAPWLIYISARIHVRQDPCMYVQCQSALSSPATHDSFIYMPWVIYMCDMTHSFMRHDSFECTMTLSYTLHLLIRLVWSCDACLVHMCAMTHWYMCHDSFIYALWISLMSHDSFIHVQ